MSPPLPPSPPSGPPLGLEQLRKTELGKKIYARRKETIERVFGTAKEYHGFRYTQYIGKARMEMKAGLTFACMNLKKLARILAAKGRDTKESVSYLKLLINLLRMIQEKEKWCWA